MLKRTTYRGAASMLLALAWMGVSGCSRTTKAPPPPPPELVVSPALSAELAAGKYVRGATDAPVTIVEFADYQCPFCAAEEPIMERLLHEYGSRLRLVYHDYPVGHPHSIEMAEAARCGGEQGGFWTMHDFLFKHAETFDSSLIAQYASNLGLDGQALEECVKSGRYRKSIDADAAIGRRAGVHGTPTFFVNGKRLVGGQTYDMLKKAIDEALASSEAGSSNSK